MAVSDSIIVKLASEVATTGEFNRVTKLPSILTPTNDNESLLRAVKAIKAILDAREGVSGSVLDKNLTMRDLMNAGALQVAIGGRVLGTTTTSGVTFPSNPGTFGGYTDPRPLLLSPPTLTALTATGTIRTVFLKWLMDEYRNHAHVEVWRATSNSLGLAVPIGLSLSTMYVDEGVAPSTVYWYWVRAIGYDTANAPIVGAFNAVSGTSGGAQIIGNVDMGALSVQAGNIALKAIDSSKMTMTDFSTIADNPTFEAGDVGWGKEGTWAIVNDPANALNGLWCARTTAGTQALRNLVSIPTVVGDEFYAEAMIKTVGVTSGLGAAVRVIGNDATGAELYQSNGNFITGTTAYSKSSTQILIPPNVVRLSVEIVCFTTAGTVYVDNIRFQRKLTLNHLAAGSIAVGTAAIQNGAIVNAMIGTAAIDDAKIANLDAAKVSFGVMSGDRISVGTLQGNKIVANTITSLQIAANSITADRITASSLSSISANIGSITAGDVHGVALHGGNFTGAYAWPAAGGGFHLSSSGLLLGRLASGSYFQVNADGSIFSPNFNVNSAGTATFSGLLSGASGTFSGNLSAAGGTFAGSLSAATGTFGGSLTTPALTVAGGAIFSPAAAESFASTSISGASGWTVVLGPTAAVNPGATGLVNIVITCDWYTGWTTAGGETNFTTYSAPTFRLKRGGVVINTWTPYAGSLAQTMSVAFLDTPGGSATYTLEATAATSLASNPQLAHRTMTVLGVVR